MQVPMFEHRPIGGARNLLIALGLVASFFIVELVGEVLTNSLALMTDAWHMLPTHFH